MLLDQNRIVIRQRGYLELLDLSLRVIRDQAGPLFVALAAGIAPFALLDAWLLRRAVGISATVGPPYLFLGLMALAVIWQTPLATAPATMCLGRALFQRPLKAREIARELVQSLPQLIHYQVLFRGLLLGLLATAFVPFVASPYMNEVILLERNPMRAAGKGEISTGDRSSMLHRGQGGDFFVVWLLNVVVGTVLVAAVWGTLAMIAGSLLDEQDWSRPLYACLYPAALWVVAAYFAVVRFLGYLDLRIRREGWEVELLMRAELDRWTHLPQAN